MAATERSHERFQRYIEPVLDKKYKGEEFTSRDLREDVEGFRSWEIGQMLSYVYDSHGLLERKGGKPVKYRYMRFEEESGIEAGRKELYDSLYSRIVREETVPSIEVESEISSYVQDVWETGNSMILTSKVGEFREQFLEGYNIENTDGVYRLKPEDSGL